MKVLEIKNNLIKVSYDTEDKLVLAGFVVIEDEKSPYVAQIVSLKADNGISYAIAKLMFTFDSEGVYRDRSGNTVQGYILNDKGEIMQGTRSIAADLY